MFRTRPPFATSLFWGSNKGIYNVGGRLTLDDVAGQFWNEFTNIPYCLDVPRFRNIHLWLYAFPDLVANPEYLKYSRDNLNVFTFGRIDNARLYDVFALGARAMFRLVQNTGTYAGTVSRLKGYSVETDASTMFIDQDVACNGTDMELFGSSHTTETTLGTPPALRSMIEAKGSNSTFILNGFRASALRKSIIEGGTNTVIATNFTCDSYNTSVGGYTGFISTGGPVGIQLYGRNAIGISNGGALSSGNVTFAPQSPALVQYGTDIAALQSAVLTRPYVTAESLGSSGYRTWSDGFKEAWGVTGAPTSGHITVTYPVTIGSSPVPTVVANAVGITAGSSLVGSHVSAFSSTGFTAEVREWNGSGWSPSAAFGIAWRVQGN